MINKFRRCFDEFRSSDVVPTPSTTVAMTPAEDVKQPTPSGRKVKGVMKPSVPMKVNQNQTLRTENEDTCNSDDFSSFYQASSSDSRLEFILCLIITYMSPSFFISSVF